MSLDKLNFKNMSHYHPSPKWKSQNLLISLSFIVILLQYFVICNCQRSIESSFSSAETLSSLASLSSSPSSSSALSSSLGVFDNDSIAINQIISNLSLFNDGDSNEYDSVTVTLLENVTHACLQRCIEEESSFLNDFGINCLVAHNRPECYRSRCFKGCELWWHALKEFEPCQEACSSTQFYPFDLPCISACETTQRQYWHLQRLHVERLLTTSTTFTLQPQLLHDNDTLNTLTLKWPITTTSVLPAQYLASRPFNIQYQYVLRRASPAASSPSTAVNDTLDNDINRQRRLRRGQQSKQHESLGDKQSATATSEAVIGAVVVDFNEENEDVEQRQQHEEEPEGHGQEQWWNLADYNCNENFECDIMDGLMPYTTYKFRFQLPFGDNLDDMLYSTSSEEFTTPAMGSPISKPIIKQALALDDTHIAIFWEAGKFANGPLTNYKLTLQQEELQLKMEKLITPTDSYFIFPNLLPSTLYTFKLSMLNKEGEGPWAEMNISTKALMKSDLKLDDLNTFIIAGEYSIILKSLDPLVESRVLFKSEEILKDFEIHQSSKRMFVVDFAGTIFSFFLDNPSNYNIVNMESTDDDFMPLKLAVDWLNQRLYVAGVTSAKAWHIISISFNGSSLETIAKNLKTPINHMQIDPINGWLFASEKSGDLLKIDLDNLDIELISTSHKVETFTNSFDSYLLKIINNEEKSIYELSYDGKYEEKLPIEFSNKLQGDILSFHGEENILVMSNATHVLRLDLKMNLWEITAVKEVEWCLKVVPLMPSSISRGLQPLAKPWEEPENLQAVVSENKAKITWDACRQVKEFQTNAAWHLWEYELEILDVASNNAFNIRSITTTHFQVERLQSNNLYKIKVRAMFGGASRLALAATTSEWSQELITRTWPMGNYQFLWASVKGIWQSMEMFKESELKALPEENIKSFVQVNTSLYYVNLLTRELKCINLMNPEINCGFKAHNVYSVDYDWRGGKLYWSDVLRNCIIRSDLKGDNKELLPLFEARLLKLDSAKGFIYYTTDTRLLRRKLNGGLAGQEQEYYHVNGNGEIILGFAMDFQSNQIYWLVQHQEGLTKLFKTDVDSVKQEDIYDLSLPYQIQRDAFNYLPEIESFIWFKALLKQAVLVSKDNLKQLTEFPIPLKEKANFVKLKSEFTNYMDPTVMLDMVDKESVHITEGYWDDFNIKWSPAAATENITIYYKVLITSALNNSHDILTFEVDQPIVRVTEFKMAGYMINITITPFTLWTLGKASFIQLKTPAAAPKQPKNLRVFVEQFSEALQSQSNISALVRWDSPDNISSEKEVFYKIFCWLKQDLHSVEDVEDMGLKTHEVRFYNLKKEESYMFQVQAFSLSRSQGGEKTSLFTHFINPDIQSIPKLIFTTSEYIGELDLDLNQTKLWVYTSSEVEHLALISGEQRLIWVNENVELMSYQPGAASVKLARMRAEVLSLTVDWILRKVYWAELSGDIEHAVDIYELDLNQYEGRVMLGSKILSLNQGKLLRNLIVLPYSRSLLWLEHDMGSRNATLQGRNLTDFTEIKFKNLLPLTNIFEGSLTPEMESINMVDFKGKISAYEIQRQLLTTLKIPYNIGEGFAIFERDNGYIYALSNHTVKAFNRRKHNMEFSQVLPEIRLIKAFNYQEYPKRECLVMEEMEESNEENFKHLFIKEIMETYVVLDLVNKNPFANCKLPLPGLKYHVNVEAMKDYEQQFLMDPGVLNITDLKPYTNYSFSIKSSSYYQQKLMLNETEYPLLIITTKEGYPSRPLNFTVTPVSPSEISVLWSEPSELNANNVTYQLFWQLQNSTLTSHKIVEGFEVNLLNLEPAQEYLIWLEVYTKPSKWNSTEKLLIQTYPEPELLQLIEKQAYNLTLLWLPNSHFDKVILECRPLSQDPEITPFSIDITGIADNFTVINLAPKTKYEFYFKLDYPYASRSYSWPELQSSYFIFETLGDAPGRPGQPQIEHITGEIFKVFWDSASDNGSPITQYSLEALQARQHKRIRRDSPPHNNHTSPISLLSQLPWVEELQPLEDKWLVYCNTSELSCIVRELHTMRLLMFRVRARNEPYGWGPYSEDSERVLEPFVSPQKRNSLVLAILAPAAIVTTCVIILFIVRKVHKRRLKAKQLLAKSRPSIWSNFSSIQQQQQLASRTRAFSMTSASTMYTGGPLSDADIALLPHINWSQITLLNFLGSGAFGEVYEGLIKHEDEEQPEKVAIKSLRKGASEFAELLQEAQLMSNFKHENIVRLIGVCCDTESISIIMEHMEGGDLLSYLRESRPNSTKPVASLQLLDLMSMCIDVATGMAYLEDMHFVHRDLACRNCLVSSRIPSKRMVKIGDFGLARDIYKNDYYRKEGEALMPVRWMAPESLVDGVFTTQTDVWAFGVLCWEILTLGQQPYAARNNFEVLNFVKEGGRLEQPDNCPDKLFSLMLECWHTDSESRPSFRKCFNSLLAIKTDVRRVSLGYNMDDSDYAMYANQHGIVFSTFLASSPLNKVKEEDEEMDHQEDFPKTEIKQNSLNTQSEEETQLASKRNNKKLETNSLCDKIDLKVRFNSNVSMKDIDNESINDDSSHLIDTKLYRTQENPDYYVNEGISRL